MTIFGYVTSAIFHVIRVCACCWLLTVVEFAARLSESNTRGSATKHRLLPLPVGSITNTSEKPRLLGLDPWLVFRTPKVLKADNMAASITNVANVLFRRGTSIRTTQHTVVD